MQHRRTLSLIVAFTGLALVSLQFAKNLSNQVPAAEAAGLTATQVSADVPTDRAPEIYRGSFLYTTADAMLKALGVTIYREDKIVAFPDPALGIGSTISVYRAQLVSIADAGNATETRTWAKTVGDVLTEQRVSIGSEDIVDPPQATTITLSDQPFHINITRVQENQAVESQSIDYDVQYVDDPNLEKGKQQVTQAGEEGLLERTYTLRYENGALVSKTLIDKTVVKEPVTKIVHNGTKVVSYGTGTASWYGGVPALTAAHRTLPMGTVVKVTNLSNGKSVIVTIADRGPFVGGRIIDLSSDAFAQIASLGSGVANVKIEQAN